MATERGIGSNSLGIRATIMTVVHNVTAEIFRKQTGMFPEELARANPNEGTNTPESTLTQP